MRAEKVARKIRKAGHRKEGQDVEIDFPTTSRVESNALFHMRHS